MTQAALHGHYGALIDDTPAPCPGDDSGGHPDVVGDVGDVVGAHNYPYANHTDTVVIEAGEDVAGDEVVGGGGDRLMWLAQVTHWTQTVLCGVAIMSCLWWAPPAREAEKQAANDASVWFFMLVFTGLLVITLIRCRGPSGSSDCSAAIYCVTLFEMVVALFLVLGEARHQPTTANWTLSIFAVCAANSILLCLLVLRDLFPILITLLII